MTGLVPCVRGVLESGGIAQGHIVLAAVSGGPDSTALLRVLADLRGEMGFTLCASIVDHGIRPQGEVAAEIEFVRGLCGALDIPLSVKAVPPGECAARARSSGASPEEAARDLRHSLLREAALEAGASVIAVGHTQDDVIETLLMRLLQGSDVHGLRGIPPRRGPFLRPMLRCTRGQVREYLESLGQGWREDPSNRDTTFLRNRVRSRLLPLLEAEFPGFRTSLLLLARKLSLSGDLVRNLADGLKWETDGTGFSIAAARFETAHPAVRAWSLLRLYDRFRPAGSPRRLPWRFLQPALEPGVPAAPATILRGHRTVLSRAAGRLWWGPDIARMCKKGYFIVVSDARVAEIREAGVRVCVTRGPGADRAGGGGIVILAGKVRPPIVLRSKRKGDVIRLSGGTTSVKELLIGMKVPAAERDRVPILSDRGGVLAVLGEARGYRTRARAGILAADRGARDRITVNVQGGTMEEVSEQQR
jgi:tRNA(Ile)-lysidine synthetase-like protein